MTKFEAHLLELLTAKTYEMKKLEGETEYIGELLERSIDGFEANQLSTIGKMGYNSGRRNMDEFLDSLSRKYGGE